MRHVCNRTYLNPVNPKYRCLKLYLQAKLQKPCLMSLYSVADLKWAQIKSASRRLRQSKHKLGHNHMVLPRQQTVTAVPGCPALLPRYLLS